MTRRWQRALVTGASSGLGAAFATILAAEGTDLVIVARRVDLLDDLAVTLRRRHQVDVEVLAADLTDRGQLAVVEERLRQTERPTDLLINNAGLGTGGDFRRTRLDLEQKSMDLLVSAPVRLTHAALPGYVERGGAVVLVSSLAAFLASPWGPTYAAGKMFEVTFADALSEQVRGTRASITAVCPGFIGTDFQNRTAATGAPVAPYPRFLEMSADRVARSSLDAAAAGKVRFVPGTGYRLVAGVVNAMPSAARRALLGRISRARGSS